jgi:hypothetical protein
MPSETERAWVAGIIDGDGCVTLASQGSRRSHRKPYVVVDSTDFEILAELQRLYGGSLVAKRTAQDHHRQAWSWRTNGTDRILGLLQDVLPFMRCAAKVERARMLTMEFKVLTPRNGRYTAEMLAAKRAFEERFMAVGAGRASQAARKADGSNARV